ncbi:MAG: nucleoside transporter [Planctomycetota bacterium]|nr:nucleoside transporter [Planctomycetota bacterium]
MAYIGVLGFAIFLLTAWALSGGKRIFNWRLFAWTIVFEFVFGWFVFRYSAGLNFFTAVNAFLVGIIDAAMAGPQFVFGSLADPAASAANGVGFVLVFQGFAQLFVIASLLAALYHLGVLGRILKFFAAVFSRLTRISGAEALAATANVFAGNEGILAIRPCLAQLTKSELCVLLATCMATISANMLVVYVNVLRHVFPTIGGHFVSASILSVPLATLMAKLATPETAQPETLGVNVEPYYKREDSLVAAVVSGANDGFKVIVGIVALLIAGIGILAILNAGIAWGGGELGLGADWSLQKFIGYLFYPCAWLMGVPWHETPTVAQLLGTRVIATEVPAYVELADLMRSGQLSPRSAVIAAYALCGYAHIPSMAIYVGALAALTPERKADIAAVAWTALVVATLACLGTGAIAGLFYRGAAILS